MCGIDKLTCEQAIVRLRAVYSSRNARASALIAVRPEDRDAVVARLVGMVVIERDGTPLAVGECLRCAATQPAGSGGKKRLRTLTIALLAPGLIYVHAEAAVGYVGYLGDTPPVDTDVRRAEETLLSLSSLPDFRFALFAAYGRLNAILNERRSPAGRREVERVRRSLIRRLISPVAILGPFKGERGCLRRYLVLTGEETGRVLECVLLPSGRRMVTIAHAPNALARDRDCRCLDQAWWWWPAVRRCMPEAETWQRAGLPAVIAARLAQGETPATRRDWETWRTLAALAGC